MQLNFIAIFALGFAALSIAAPAAAPKPDADAVPRIHAAEDVNLEAIGAGY